MPLGVSMRRLGFVLLLAAGLTCDGQTWIKIAVESTTTTVTLPVGSIYRLGSGTCWSANTTTITVTPLALYWPSGSFPFVDPCPGVAKELDVLETAIAQTVTTVIAGKSSVVTVPALSKPPPTSTTYTFSCTGTVGGTITITAAGIATLTASTITLSNPCNGTKQ